MIDLSLATDVKAEVLQAEPPFNTGFNAEIINTPRYTVPRMVRDDQGVTLEEAHYRLSALPAHAAGFRDRGILREGAWADVVVYDLKNLGIEPEWVGEVTHDLPGGEWRRVQRAKGYRSIIVNGVETFAEDKCTDATPGKLLRHGHA